MGSIGGLLLGRSRVWILFATLLFIEIVRAAPSNKGDCERVYPHQSIQNAIDRARPGDRIEVDGGVYYEQLTIRKDGLQLIGKNGATLKPPEQFHKNRCSGLTQTKESKATEAGICIQGRHVELEDYVAEHRKIKSVGNFIENVSVTGFIVGGFDGENIAAVGAKNVKVSNNALVDGGEYGFLSVGSKGTRAERNVVSTASLNFIGMCIDDYSDGMLSENEVTGYFTGLVAQTPGGLVTKNKVTNVCVGAASDPGVKGALIVNNYFNLRNPACDKDYKIYGAGVVVFGAVETIVKGNTIENFHNTGVGVGIFLTDGPTGEVATKNVVRKNILRNNDFDIYDNSSSTAVNDLGDNTCTMGSVPPAACN